MIAAAACGIDLADQDAGRFPPDRIAAGERRVRLIRDLCRNSLVLKCALQQLGDDNILRAANFDELCIRQGIARRFPRESPSVDFSVIGVPRIRDLHSSSRTAQVSN